LPTNRRVQLTFALVSTALLAGCSGAPARVVPPAIPADAAQAAVAQFDKNGNQAIDGAELDQVPSIKSALRRIDRNQDNQVNAAEIAGRIQSWRDSKVGLMQVSLTLTMDGQPLSGAEVRIVPEEFLGSAVQPARALTDNSGRAALRISEEPTGAGVQLGLYRIEISKKSGAKETIPEKYNQRTQLGCEIAMDNSLADGDWILRLTR
jgi:hypothetical protein